MTEEQILLGRKQNWTLLEMDQKSIEQYVTEQNCQWIFNPPHASHFGGVWERHINTIRRVLDGMFADLADSFWIIFNKL